MMNTWKPLGLVLLGGWLAACSTPSSPFESVDPFIGTGGHGHTFPGATLPFGMVQLSPDTRLTGWDGCSGYHYSDSLVYGFSHTHLSGTGVSDYGDVLLMPYTGETEYHNGADGRPGYRSAFTKGSEEAQPGYYALTLREDAIGVELTASTRVGFHRYTFQDAQDRHLLLDLSHRDSVLEAGVRQVDAYTLSGYRHSRAWAEQQQVYFRMVFDQPIQSIAFAPGDSTRLALYFGEGEALQVKVALSAVDEAGAAANLGELPHWDFAQARAAAREAWEKQLHKIEVQGGSDRQRRIFYTALYHTMLAPNVYHDVDGRYRSTDLQVHHDTSFTNHTVFSLWDTYRSTHPLYTLIEQERTHDFIQTFLRQYQYGGRLPMWELAGNYTGCMIGYHAVPVIADAYLKGLRDYDTRLALEAMVHSAQQNRLGMGAYRRYGYIPADAEAESVSKTLEYAYDDWTIAQMAAALGDTVLADTFYRRARRYQNVLDPGTGFMRARSNNRWVYPFAPSEVNFHYTEANAWQYSYYVPQDLETWIDLLGGVAAAEGKLDALFTAESATSGREQADITGLIGQYAHGNEPSHHIPYLYNFVGRPDKTQQRVRQIMATLYHDEPDGLSGNEDCGQMSSWLVLSALGFYPVTPGSPDYILGSPWFERATLHLENGKDFHIEAQNQSPKSVYVQQAHLNGEAHPFTYLRHADIMQGGTFTFTLGSEPGDWGREPTHWPKSRIVQATVPIPSLTAGDHAFLDSTVVALALPDPEARIRYSLADQDTLGLVYRGPFAVRQSTDLWVWAEKGGRRSGRGHSVFTKIPQRRGITLGTEYAPHYAAGGDMALVDFVRGGPDFRTGAWQGYEGVDLEAVVDLGQVGNYRSLKIGFLQDENSWIFLPTEVQFYASVDGREYTPLGTVENEIPYLRPGTVLQDFALRQPIRARYLKVVAKNRGVCPPDHKGAGNPCWIFADEIILE